MKNPPIDLDLREFPFVKLLAALLAGILWNLLLPLGSCWIVLLFFLVVWLYGHRSDFHRRSLLIGATLFCIGFFLSHQADETERSDHFSQQKAEYLHLRLTDIQAKSRSTQVKAAVIGIIHQGTEQASCGNILIYLPKDSSLVLRYGEEILIPARYKEVEGPRNPGEFHFKRYLFYQHIQQQAFVRLKDWHPLSHFSGNPVTAFALDIREQLLQVFKEQLPHADRAALLSALLLGYRAELDKELVQAFSDTGTTHVLSVSGLHVGIIYGVLNYLLSFLLRFRYGKIVRGLLIMMLVCLYALISGLSPCVCRAALMISLVVIGQWQKHPVHVYNTMAASAFFLLVYEPYLITDVGFQLSYLALWGIVWLQPLIHNWIHCPNKWLDKLWLLSSVSIAAQTLTLPLSWYYFQQFPVYFIPANWLIIPCSTLILYGGLLVLICSPFPAAAGFFAWLTDELIGWMNQGTLWMQNLPGSVWYSGSVLLGELALISCFIALVITYGLRPKAVYLLSLLSLLLFLLCITTWSFRERYLQPQRVSLHFQKQEAQLFYYRDRSWLICTTPLSPKEQNYTLRNTLRALNCGAPTVLPIDTFYRDEYLCLEKGILQFGKGNTAVTDKSYIYPPTIN